LSFVGCGVLIDSHAHLAGERFDTDRSAVLERAWSAGLVHVVVIGDAGRDAGDLARTDPSRLSFTAGVHPHEAHTFDAAAHVPMLRERVAEGAVAIGECGLDYFYDHSPRDRQLEALNVQVALAAEYALPLVVHTRQAEADTIRVMQSAATAGVRGVLHCFTGSPELARAAIDVEWCISISGIATFRNWERDDVIAAVPDHLLMIETDAPYLAPVPQRGKRNESAFLSHTAARVAAVRHTSLEALSELTARNAIRFFGLSLSAHG
jgi:TatD DNase family protein